MSRSVWKAIVRGSLAAWLLGGASLAAAPTAQAQADKGKKPANAPEQIAPATDDPTYVIGAQDGLHISVWKEPELTLSVTVRPDGKISLPLLNDVQASGMTPIQLAQSVTEKLKKFVTEPQVTVIVTSINSQRIYIVGEISRSGAFPLLPGMTVLQAIASAGSFTQFANQKAIYVLRTENGKQVKYPFNYKEVIKGKNPQQNITLKPGDTIVVP